MTTALPERTMRHGLLIMLGVLAAALSTTRPAAAQSAVQSGLAVECTQFTVFPLTLNLGAPPTGLGGETLRCVNGKIQAAVNSLYTGNLNGLQIMALAPLNLRMAGTHNPNVILAGAGNRVSFCPLLSCVLSPSIDHQRTSLLISAETQDDGHSEEQTLAVTTSIKTGFYKPWATSTRFEVGDNVNMQGERNAVYRATQGGTSAASGIGPSGKGVGIVDGTVRWEWINDAAINAKVGIYNETVALPGGGNAWGAANNFEMREGYIPRFAVGYEFDFTNNSGTDCTIGVVAGCNNLYLRTYGSNKSTSSMNIEGPDSGNASAYFGAFFHGSRLSSDATIEIDTGGAYGIRIGGFLPAGYAGAAILDQSSSARGIQLAGTYGVAQISGTGFQIDPTGSGLLANLTVNGNFYEPSPYVPPTSTTVCVKGQRAWDASYEYRCVSNNTWKRATLSTW